MSEKTNIQPQTIRSLAAKYGVSRQTFAKWLEPFRDELNMQKHVYIFTPAQVAIIYSKLDPPE